MRTVMNRRDFLLLAGFTSCALVARARAATSDDQLVRSIAATISRSDGVRARFTQTRTLAAMKTPVVSRGDVIVAPERGIIWRVAEPYRATYVIGEQGIVQWDADASGAQTARHEHGASQAASAQAAAMMRSLAGGDLSLLYAQFRVEASGTPAQWTLQLTPAQPQLAQAIRDIRIEGAEHVQRLQLTTAHGDTTVIAFTGSTRLGRLSDEERAMFEMRA
jgi:outer membrane lipoprotein-sorting protein